MASILDATECQTIIVKTLVFSNVTICYLFDLVACLQEIKFEALDIPQESFCGHMN
jgi:hypothetical protein